MRTVGRGERGGWKEGIYKREEGIPIKKGRRGTNGEGGKKGEEGERRTCMIAVGFN